MKRQSSEKFKNGVKKISSLVKLRSKGKNSEEFKKSAPAISSKPVSHEETEKFQKFFQEFNEKYSDSDTKTKQQALFELMKREDLKKLTKMDEEVELDLEVTEIVQDIFSPRSNTSETLKTTNYNTKLTEVSQLPKLNFRKTTAPTAQLEESLEFEVTQVESPKEQIKIETEQEVKVEEQEILNVDASKLTKSELLFYYTKIGNFDGVKEIISFDKQLLRISEPDTKLNLLHFSTLHNHFKIIEYLIENGIDVNSSDKFNRTALLIACSKGYKEIVHLILQNGGNMNVRDFYGYTPAQLALKSKNYDLVEDLMLYGCDLNLKNFNGYTSLHICLQNGDVEGLNFLLTKNVKLNIRNQNDETPLLTGVKFNKVEAVSILLKTPSVDLFCKNQLNQNILHMVCYFGYIDMMNLFLENFDEETLKKFTESKDYRGRTPVHYCCQQNHLECLELLKSFICNIDGQDAKGDTALHLSMSYPEIARFLVQMGASRTIKNEKNITVNQINAKLERPIDWEWGRRFNISTF